MVEELSSRGHLWWRSYPREDIYGGGAILERTAVELAQTR